MSDIKQYKTYLGLAFQSEDQSTANSVEFDLITSRQKGEEVRYLSITVMTKTEDMEHPVELTVSVERESFDKIKQFFTQLEWEK